MFSLVKLATVRNKTRLTLALTLYICTLPLSAQMMEQSKPRVLSGVVTDSHHEPLRGAVVKLQVGDTADITTYITAADGHYIFKRLNSGTDYNVWVSFRGHSTKHHEISKFDPHTEKVLDFTVEDF